MDFSFATATRVHFGANSLSRLSAAAKEANAWGRKALVVIGSSASRASPLLEQLTKDQVAHVLYSVSGEPTVEVADRGTELARAENVDFVIGFGGGSVLDTGKAIAALVTNGGVALDYLEVVGRGLPLAKPSLPYIAIPTTAGTGAEVTKNAVLTSTQHRQKASLRSAYMLPTLALIDPVLTVQVPPHVTASTGLDAFIQCLEPLVSCNANPVCDAVAIKGLEYGARSIRRAFAHPDDVQARTDMSLCSLFGGMALANAKLGAIHGFAGVLGGLLPDAPHGCLCAALLPATIRVNVAALAAREPANPALRKYQDAARVVLGNSAATVDDLVAWCQETCQLLQIKSLSAYGLKLEDFPLVVEKSANASSMKGNPIKLTNAELEQMLTASMNNHSNL